MFINKSIKDVIPHIDLSQSRKIIEVGGRDGSFLAELMKINHNLSGVVIDQTLYRNFVEKTIQEYDIRDRVKIVSGNYIDSIPEGFDSVILKSALSEFNDEELEKILKNCRKAIQPNNKLWILDMLIDRNNPENLNLISQLDVFNLLTTNGKIRSKSELEPILERSGFRVSNYTPIRSMWVIEAMAL